MILGITRISSPVEPPKRSSDWTIACPVNRRGVIIMRIDFGGSSCATGLHRGESMKAGARSGDGMRAARRLGAPDYASTLFRLTMVAHATSIDGRWSVDPVVALERRDAAAAFVQGPETLGRYAGAAFSFTRLSSRLNRAVLRRRRSRGCHYGKLQGKRQNRNRFFH